MEEDEDEEHSDRDIDTTFDDVIDYEEQLITQKRLKSFLWSELKRP